MAAGAEPESEPEPVEVVLSGTLHKRGRVNTAWRRRYMALTADGDLQYRKNERMRGVVNVRGATIDTEPPELKGGRAFAFAVRQQPQRTFFLAAESSMELVAWTEALHVASAATPRESRANLRSKNGNHSDSDSD